MSLASLLQSYSQDISARETHNNELADANAERKAQSNEEKFDSYLSSLNQGATDLATASGAYHLGRKVYKKFQTGKKVVKQLQQLVDQAKGQGSSSTDPTGEEGEDNVRERPNVEADPAGEADRAPTNPAPEGALPEDPAPRAPTEPAEQPASGETATADAPHSGGGDAPAPAEPSDAVPTRSSADIQGDLNDLEARQSSYTSSRQNLTDAMEKNQDTVDAYQGSPADEPLNVSTARSELSDQREQLANLDQENAGLQGQIEETRANLGRAQASEDLQEARTLNASARSAPGQEAPARDTNSGERVVDGEEQPTGDLGRNLGEEQEAPSNLELGTREIGDVDRSAGALQRAGGAVQDTINGVKESAGNFLKQVGTKTASAVKSVLPESMGNFLEGGAGIGLEAGLDAIPVVGEVASVITGLVSLFEGIGHKDTDDNTQQTTAPVGEVATGIDPTALEKNQTATATIV